MILPDSTMEMKRRYAEGPATLEAALEFVPRAVWKWRPGPSEWSVHEIVVHCADSEIYAAIRLKLLLAEPRPVIVGYDQDRWATEFAYHDQSIETTLAAIRAARALTLPIVESLNADQLRRVGHHSQDGEYGVSDWLGTYSNHLHIHADQIAANIEGWHLRSEKQ